MSEHWIVVGAGSAGCVAAARLAEAGDRSVTLLEAGPALAPGEVPAGIDSGDFFDAVVAPARVHDGLVARRQRDDEHVPYLRGRGVGGSSAVNSMIGLRGDPALYRSWGWLDVEAGWDRVQVPVEPPAAHELGAVDRALIAAAPDADLAPLTRRDGRRVTAAEAYLWPLTQNRRLTVRADAPVDRVIVDARRATGVRLADGTELAADRVVVAAGAIHSPAILLRSGVDTAGVGEGLQDHPAAAITLELRGGRDGAAAGRLAIGSLLHRDDLQVLPMNHLGAAPDAAGLGLLMVALMRPRSPGGRVRLASPDPMAHPEVDFDLLASPADLAALRRGVKVLLDLLARDPFAEIVERASIDEHGTAVEALADDDRIDRWLRTTGANYVHAACSCRMGTVVGDGGEVRGYAGLYVCDASVFPAIPDVNTHLPTMMLAERLAARWTSPR